MLILSEALDLFITAALAEGKAESSVRWYRQRLGRLLAFLGDVSLDAVAVADLRRFMVSLRECDQLWANNPYRRPSSGKLSPSTLQGYVRALKGFFNWLEREEYLTPRQNPVVRLKRPPIPKLPPKDVQMDDIRTLLEAALVWRYFSSRNYAIILFLADTGCRVGGLVGLRLADLDLDLRTALVTEKGSKSRPVFFSELTGSALRDWLGQRPADTDFVFVGERGPLTVFGVNQMLSKLQRRAGIKGHVNPHSFRHGFAKRYLMAGGDLGSLADLMGHSDVGVTKRSYSVFLVEELQRKHDLHSPLAHLVE